MRRLSDDLDELFGQLVGGAAITGAVAAPLAFVADAPVDWVPAIETFQREGKLVVQADLPGLQADDVTVEIDDGVLTLSGERREEHEVDESGVRRTERRYGRFTRSIALPEGARTEEVQASFCNGVLEITVPLSQSSQQRRAVQIQNASGDRPESEGANGGRASATGSPGS
jgi:HSP20 family protein